MISEHASPLAALGSCDSGGQNVYVAQLTQHLADCGAEVDVFTRRDSPDLPEVVQWHRRARVIHVPAGPPAAIPKEELLPHMPGFTRFVRGICERRRYDLLHAHFWMSGMAAIEVKRRLGIPVVVTFHALGRIRRLHQGGDDRFPDCRFDVERQVAAEADCVIAECPQDRADLIRYYDADPGSIIVVPCGFDPRELAPVPREQARAALGLPADQFVVLQLGRMVRRKGIATAVRGFARFMKHGPHDARLLVVGGESASPDPGSTPEIGRLSAIASSEGISDAVVFTGRRDRGVLRYYYSAADVFVTLPWYEPFGITPLEAMACRTPVIGSRVGGIKYTVRDGMTGCLVPPRDPDALASCLDILHRDRRIRERMGRYGRARVLGRFTWARVADEIQSAYRDVLNGRGRESLNVRAASAGAAVSGVASGQGGNLVPLAASPLPPYLCVGNGGSRASPPWSPVSHPSTSCSSVNEVADSMLREKTLPDTARNKRKPTRLKRTDSGLEGQVVLVTGGASGLGAAICNALADAGATAVVSDVASDRAATGAEAIKSKGLRATATALDVRDERQAREAIARVVETHGRLDALVNNAGVDVTKPVSELSLEEWDNVLGVNLRGPFLLSKLAFEQMRRQGGGHIVNIASTAARRAWPNAAAYHASKWGLLGLSHALHVEGREHRIKVTALIAGGMKTPFLLERFPDIDQSILQDPENVARAVRFVLTQPPGTVIPELMVLPERESSWP